MKDSSEIQLLSRYIIEDNQATFFVLDEKASQDLVIIKSIFRNFLQNYRVYSKQEERLIHDEINSFMKKYEYSLREAFYRYNTSKLIDYNNLVRAFKFIGAPEYRLEFLDYIYLQMKIKSKDAT